MEKKIQDLFKEQRVKLEHKLLEKSEGWLSPPVGKNYMIRN